MRSFISDIFRLVKTYRKGLLIFCVVMFLAAIALGFAGFELSSHSAFCNTCHYMKPYVAAWKTSKHAHVPCAKCHYPQNFKGLMREKMKAMATTIRYFINAYDMTPKAEIEDANCLQSGCHEKRLLSGPVTYKKNIRFNHEHHLKQLRRGKQLKCTTCHSQIVQGDHISVTESVCFICHFKGAVPGEGVADCTICHGAPKVEVAHEGFSFSHEEYLKAGVACHDCHTQVTRGDGNVPKQRCTTCHMQPSDKYDDSEFIHNTHVTEHKVECFECHDEIEHGKIAFVKSLESRCDVCHSKLHNLQKEMFIGIGAKDVPDCPDPMFMAQVGCDGCHRNGLNKNVSLPTEVLPSDVKHPTSAASDFSTTCPEEAKPYAKASSCVACHGKRYGAMLGNWRWAFEEYTEKLRPLYEKAKGALIVASDAASSVTDEPTQIRNSQFAIRNPHEPTSEGNDDGAKAAKAAPSNKADEAAPATIPADKIKNAKELFDTASYNYDFVKKAHGVHNVLYAKKILLKVQENLNKSLALLSPDHSSDNVLGISDRDVAPGCTQRCHVGVERIKTVAYGGASNEEARYEVVLPHSAHVSKPNLTCTNCHAESTESDDPNHGSVELARLDTQGSDFEASICFKCHYSQEGTDCNQCHHIQNAIFVGEADENVTFSFVPAWSSTLSLPQPSPHTTRIDCKACHVAVKHIIKSEDEKTSAEANRAQDAELKNVCDKCHTKGTGKMMVRLWQKQIREPYEQLASSLSALQGKLKSISKDNTPPSADIEKAMTLSRNVEKALELIRKDGSWGVHNFELIRALVTQSAKSLRECDLLISRALESRSVERNPGGR